MWWLLKKKVKAVEVVNDEPVQMGRTKQALNRLFLWNDYDYVAIDALMNKKKTEAIRGIKCKF